MKQDDHDDWNTCKPKYDVAKQGISPSSSLHAPAVGEDEARRHRCVAMMPAFYRRPPSGSEGKNETSCGNEPGQDNCAPGFVGRRAGIVHCIVDPSFRFLL